MKKNDSGWNITDQRFVGYIDIMGFKDIVARNSHGDIYKMMKSMSNALKVSQDAFEIDEDNNSSSSLIKLMSYSDSIMMYSRDDSIESMEGFISAMSFLAENLFSEEIPHKGAVAFGTMTLDFENSIFFGQPLIDAYLLHDELNFYGIVVHNSIESNKKFTQSALVVEYLCPFKNGIAKHLTICPLPFDVQYSFLETCRSQIASVKNLRYKTSGSLRKYIDNTIAYLEYVQTLKKK